MARQTDRFYQAIRKSHRIISWVDVIGVDREVFRLPAIDGSVDVDRSAAYRRKVSVDCVDVTGQLTPRKNGELLTPHGTELRPYRGVRYSDAPEDYEVAPLGVFRLSDADITDTIGGSPVISLEGFDRARAIARDRFRAPHVVTVGTNALDAIKAIVRMTFPSIKYDAVTTSATTASPMVFDAGSDPWEAITLLATSMGCEAYFDVEGALAILPPHDVNALPAPSFSYMEGEGCTMLELKRTYRDEGMFNGVVVTGESIGDSLPPVRGEAWDENPNSPTYWKGHYGEVPAFHQDSVAKTVDQCVTIAKAKLAGLLGASSKISVTGIVNPSYEANDIVRVKRARSGVDGLFSLDSFNVPLRSGTQALNLREQRPR